MPYMCTSLAGGAAMAPVAHSFWAILFGHLLAAQLNCADHICGSKCAPVANADVADQWL